MNNQTKEVLNIVQKHGLAIHKLKLAGLSLQHFRSIYKKHIKSFKFDNSKCSIKQIIDITFKHDYMLKVRMKDDTIENIEVPVINGNLYMCLKDYEYYLSGKISMLKEMMKTIKFDNNEADVGESSNSESKSESDISQPTQKKSNSQKQKNRKKKVSFVKNSKNKQENSIEIDSEEGFFEEKDHENLSIDTIFSDEELDILEHNINFKTNDNYEIIAKKAINLNGKNHKNIKKRQLDRPDHRVYEKIKKNSENINSDFGFFDDNSDETEYDSTDNMCIDELDVKFDEDNLKKSRNYLEAIYEKADNDHIDYTETYEL